MTDPRDRSPEMWELTSDGFHFSDKARHQASSRPTFVILTCFVADRYMWLEDRVGLVGNVTMLLLLLVLLLLMYYCCSCSLNAGLTGGEIAMVFYRIRKT